MKRKILIFTACVLLWGMNSHVWAQNVAINSTGANPAASAALDVSSTSRGLLIPRMTTIQRNLISSPAPGLIIFNTTDVCIQYYTGLVWISLCGISPNANTVCPSGMKDMNNLFSIEMNERTADTWYNAVTICNNLGMRLCTWGEWYYACQSGLVLNMVGNWEWSDDGGTGSASMKLLGQSTCMDASTNSGSTIQAFRCCCEKQ